MFSKDVERFLDYFSKNEGGRKGVACTVIGDGHYVIGYKDEKGQIFPWVSGFETAKDAEMFKYYMGARIKERESASKQPDNPLEAIQQMMNESSRRKGPSADTLEIFSYCQAASSTALDRLEEIWKNDDHRV